MARRVGRMLMAAAKKTFIKLSLLETRQVYPVAA
jgi:hypothetical protein